jgi:Arc/MetJ-type ribon-helix-helix transcriptional regulator
VTINLPEDLESSVRTEVLSGHFASADDAVAEIVRDYFRRRTGQPPVQPAPVEGTPALGSIGAMRDAANELDEIVADAMRKRREETWRVIPGE